MFVGMRWCWPGCVRAAGLLEKVYGQSVFSLHVRVNNLALLRIIPLVYWVFIFPAHELMAPVLTYRLR